MATDVRSPTNFHSNTDADFRAWGQAIGAAMVACGLVKCSAVEVAGQINWATVVRPPGPTGDVSMGYEVYKFADALQAASPVYIRITFGASNNFNAPTVPGISIIVINGAIDGNGNPAVGATTSPNTGGLEFGAANTLAGVGGNGTFQTCGAPNRIAQRWMMGQGAGYGCEWGVERTKDSAGADTTEGVIVQFRANSMWNRVRSVFFPSANGANGGGYGSIVLLNNGDNAAQPKVSYLRAPHVFAASRAGGVPARSGQYGANTAVWPWILPSPRGHDNPGMNFVGVWNGDIAVNAQFLAKMYGLDHNYRMGSPGDFIGGGWFDTNVTASTMTLDTAMASAMRWE